MKQNYYDAECAVAHPMSATHIPLKSQYILPGVPAGTAKSFSKETPGGRGRIQQKLYKYVRQIWICDIL
jgi:hypothetical protein